MGCGLLATAAGIVKMVYTHNAVHMIDFFYQGVKLTIFSCVERSVMSSTFRLIIEYSLVELFLGIIGSCVPCLKHLWDQLLRRMGFELSKSNTPPQLTTYGSRSSQNGMKLSSYSSRPEAQVWEGGPGYTSFTDASAAAGKLVRPNEKDVIVKESYVSWESTSA
jgi:hypothetical protein